MAFLTRKGQTYSPPPSVYIKYVPPKPPSLAPASPKPSTNPFVNALNSVKTAITGSVQTAAKEVSQNPIIKTVYTTQVNTDKNIVNTLQTAKNDIQDVGNKITQSATTFAGDVAKGAQSTYNYLGNTKQTLLKDVGQAGKDVSGFAGTVSKDVSGFAGTVSKDVSGFFGGIANWFKSYWYIIVAAIVGIILLIVFVYAKAGGSIVGA